MNGRELSKLRDHLGKTQAQMADLLGVSYTTMQSYEQGWRKIPTHAERHALFLLVMKKSSDEKAPSCWEVKKCPPEIRARCPAWEFQCGHLCWFINGSFCQGKVHKTWKTRMRRCRKCEVFRLAVPSL